MKLNILYLDRYNLVETRNDLQEIDTLIAKKFEVKL